MLIVYKRQMFLNTSVCLQMSSDIATHINTIMKSDPSTDLVQVSIDGPHYNYVIIVIIIIGHWSTDAVPDKELGNIS